MTNAPDTQKTPQQNPPEKWRANLMDTMQALRGRSDPRFEILLAHGSMSVEVYAPDKIDHQTPHRQDELYIIQSGSGMFYRDGSYSACAAGDVLFVPAGMAHRFEDFSDDFVTWVIFWGPKGGETS
ncbi:cupin domain-containing protein [Thalassospira sp. MCCC 1A01428]|uniref:cupin domain-containing protein n=1 Tax=Thalassospira sp. MCCC 1A01428 TaxID=1470575 RepID=UPI001AEFA85F|nr:cupin domain-containing protein [Thalassospira sp. MCCC 1A01428]